MNLLIMNTLKIIKDYMNQLKFDYKESKNNLFKNNKKMID